MVVREGSRVALSDKLSYAKALAESGLLPESFRRQPANVLYAMEYGAMLGLPPMAAITGIHVIEGKPGASAALMSALVRQAGHKLRVWFDEESFTARAELVRKDDPEFTYRSKWDLPRAVTAELCTIKDGKPYARSVKGKVLTWEKFPPNMLKWRAVSEVCRDGAEECLMGMHYTPEELGAVVDGDGDPVRAVSERTSSTSYVTRVSDGQIVNSVIDDDDDWDVEIEKCVDSKDRDELVRLWKRAKDLRPDDDALRVKIEAAGPRILDGNTSAESASAGPHSPVTLEYLAGKNRRELEKHLFALLGEGGFSDSTTGRETRLLILSRLCNKVPAIKSSTELSDSEIAGVITTLDRYQREDRLFEELDALSTVTES